MVLRSGLMSTVPTRLPLSSPAFDLEAVGYADRWDRSPIVQLWRGRVISRVVCGTQPGGRIADLGMGIGTDAFCLGAAGFRVVGLDGSPGMVAAARERGLTAQLGDLRDASGVLGDGFDSVLCNFGVMNCLDSLHVLCETLTTILRPGGRIFLVWMTPHCPVEAIARLIRLQRPRRGRSAARVAGVSVPLRWWSVDEVKKVLKPSFHTFSVEAVGLFDPPPDLGGRPGWRTRVEPRLAAVPVLRALGVHTLLVAERAT